MKSSLMTRAGSICELCSADAGLSVYDVLPNAGASLDTSVLVCEHCLGQLDGSAPMDANHWRCLSESMWSEHAAVKVVAYRMLKGLGATPWAEDLLGQIYLDEETQQWADSGLAAEPEETFTVVDSNGTTLGAGDSVTLIKDLDVKGANFTAKRGTVVKNISLTDDPKFVEGRVNGIRIVLVAAYLKKA